jgi:diguanylate cyclase (GGDEF)-like protein
MQAGVSQLNRERQISYWNGGGGGRAESSAGEALDQEYGESMMAMVDDAGTELSDDRYPPDGVIQDQAKHKANEVTEFYLRHNRGDRIPVSVRGLSIRNSAGNIAGAVEVFGNSPVRLKFDQRVSELERLAFRDALTGLPNRRHIALRVEQGLQDHQRQGRLYGLLMFDIDCFKQVNSTHGCDAGDAVLKAIGESVARGLRSSDILGRWGGEVFLVLAPDVDAVALGDLAERCRVLIAQSSVAAASARVSVTASIGATVLIHSDSANSVIRRADELMFQSRHSGGDRTTAG